MSIWAFVPLGPGKDFMIRVLFDGKRIVPYELLGRQQSTGRTVRPDDIDGFLEHRHYIKHRLTQVARLVAAEVVGDAS